MIAKIRETFGGSCRSWIAIAGFVGTSLAGGFGAHRAVIADVRTEIGDLSQTMADRDAAISSRQDRMEAQLCERLKTIETDIKTILRQGRH